MAQIKRTDNGHAEPEQHGEDAQQVEEASYAGSFKAYIKITFVQGFIHDDSVK